MRGAPRRARLVHHAAVLVEPVGFPSTAIHAGVDHPVVRGGSPRGPGGRNPVRSPRGARGRLGGGHRDHSRMLHALSHGHAAAAAARATVVRVWVRWVRAVLMGRLALLLRVSPPCGSPWVRLPRLAGLVGPRVAVLRDVRGVVTTAVRRVRGYGVVRVAGAGAGGRVSGGPAMAPVARSGALGGLVGLGSSAVVPAVYNKKRDGHAESR